MWLWLWRRWSIHLPVTLSSGSHTACGTMALGGGGNFKTLPIFITVNIWGTTFHSRRSSRNAILPSFNRLREHTWELLQIAWIMARLSYLWYFFSFLPSNPIFSFFFPLWFLLLLLSPPNTLPHPPVLLTLHLSASFPPLSSSSSFFFHL